MADITQYINDINAASKGEEVRTTIVNALNALNNGATNSKMLEGHPANYFVSEDELKEMTNFDEKPTEGSSKGVRSGGLYDFFKTLDDLLTQINGGDA